MKGRSSSSAARKWSSK